MKFKSKVAGALSMLGLFTASVLAVNSYDPAPSMEMMVADDQTQCPERMPAEKNGYFFAAGLMAPASQDPMQAGVEWVKHSLEMDAAYAQGDEFASAEDAVPGAQMIESLQAAIEGCEKGACLGYASNNSVRVQADLKKAQYILERYSQLTAMEFDEVSRPNRNINSFMPVYGLAARLNLLSIADMMAQGRDDEALTAWGKSAELMQGIFGGSRDIIGKMVATNLLHRHHALLMEYIQQNPDKARTRLAKLRDLAKPISGDSLNMTDAFQSESLQLARVAIRANKGELDLNFIQDKILFKPQATANAIVATFEPWFESEDLAIGSAPYQQAMAAHLQRADQPTPVGWFWLYNPVGKILAKSHSADYAKYVYRRDNLLADRALIGLQLDLLTMPTLSKESIQQRMAAKEMAHPFNGGAPMWSQDGKTIAYAQGDSRVSFSKGDGLYVKAL